MICVRSSYALRGYAAELCGIQIDKTDAETLSFAQAIVDDPSNPLPRLVFADWFDKCGDPRGELIRVEAELAIHKSDLACLATRKANHVPDKDAKWTSEHVKQYLNLIQVVNDLDNRHTALRLQLGYDDQPTKTKKRLITKRCRSCGIAYQDEAELCSDGCDPQHGFVPVLSRPDRLKCRHTWSRVNGVPSWNRLCLHCGKMSR
ncbi:TIGR02996 domain-containing protein [Thalassoroseus pseudoceratinae]|uniref:TIGR02996 domain-containing protein n=1 Tax=Thalassoroseus pseudoceratinae TaxID=2713176 RepID=UPI0036F3402A